MMFLLFARMYAYAPVMRVYVTHVTSCVMLRASSGKICRLSPSKMSCAYMLLRVFICACAPSRDAYTRGLLMQRARYVIALLLLHDIYSWLILRSRCAVCAYARRERLF